MGVLLSVSVSGSPLAPGRLAVALRRRVPGWCLLLCFQPQTPRSTARDVPVSAIQSTSAMWLFVCVPVLGSVLFGRGARYVRLLLGVSKFGVDTSGFGELVFEDDDAARGLQRGTTGDEFVGAGGDTELVAGVAAVSALGALGGEEFRGVETAQERLPDAEDVGGLAHAVCRVIFVVEFAGQSIACAVGCFCLDGVSSFVCWTGPPGVKNDKERELLAPGATGVGAPGGRTVELTYTTALSRATALVVTSGSRLLGSSEPNAYRTTHFSVSVRPRLAVLRAGSTSLPHFVIRSSLREKRYNTLVRMSTPTAVDIFQ